MNSAIVTSIHPSNHLTRIDPAAVPREKLKVAPRRGRSWTVYKPPPWWTTLVAFVISIAIHLGAVVVLETGPEGRLTALWDGRNMAAGD
jgi:hypothetical protein